MIYIDFQRLCHILIRLIIHHHIDVFNEQVSQHPLVLFIIRSCEIIGPEVNLAVFFWKISQRYIQKLTLHSGNINLRTDIQPGSAKWLT